jgi:hypothetical protein
VNAARSTPGRAKLRWKGEQRVSWGKCGVIALDADRAPHGDEMKPPNPALFAPSQLNWEGNTHFERVALEKTALCQNLGGGWASD